MAGKGFVICCHDLYRSNAEMMKQGVNSCNYKTQTREHLFKDCPQWESQQKALWAVVRAETGRGKDRFKISELFADDRSILDFLATTEVGRTAGPQVADEEPGSEASEWEKREREEYLAQVAEEEGVED